MYQDNSFLTYKQDMWATAHSVYPAVRYRKIYEKVTGSRGEIGVLAKYLVPVSSCSWENCDEKFPYWTIMVKIKVVKQEVGVAQVWNR